jgi:hypothetical protein
MARGLALQCVLLGKLPEWGIGLGGISCSIYCRVLLINDPRALTRKLGTSSQSQNTDICSRCKNYLHSNERFFRALSFCGYSCGGELLRARVVFRFAPLTSFFGPYRPLLSRQDAPDILARVHFYLLCFFLPLVVA